MRVPCNLQLMLLAYAAERVEEQRGVLRGPEVDVYGMQAVHVFAVAAGVGTWQMPLRHVMLSWAGCAAAALASEAVYGEGEETRVLVCLFYSDEVEG